MNEINKGIRAINFMIDSIILNILSIILDLIFDFGTFYFVFVLYYFSFEFFFGQTVGKMVTQTKVVDNNGNKPFFIKIILRSIFRLNPFDIISYLFGLNLGSHDILSKTRLVNK